MTDFEKALADGLTANGGKLSFEAVTDLLPATSRHKVMKYLNSAKLAGVCSYSVKREDGVMTITVTSPAPSVPVGGSA